MEDASTKPTVQDIATEHEVPCYSSAVEALSKQLIGQIADKWTMIVLEELPVSDPMRFSALRRAIPDISQKMLTQTLRRMERIGLVTRTIYPVVPPIVEYRRTELGHSLGKVVCGLWTWVENNAEQMQEAQARFLDRNQT